MDIFQITVQIQSNEDATQFLRQSQILRSVPNLCPNCNEPLKENKRKSIGDEVAWRYSRRHDNAPRCNILVSIRQGLFLEKSNLEFRKFLMLTYF